MKRITLTKDMENLHLAYYKEAIVPNFEQYKNLSQYMDGSSWVIPVDTFAHLKFMCFCISNQVTLAIGSISKLKNLQSAIEFNHKHILSMLACQDRKYKFNKTCKRPATYKEFLLSIFGYQQFSLDLYSYVKKEAGCSGQNYKKATFSQMLDKLEVLYPNEKANIDETRSKDMKSDEFQTWLIELFENNLSDITLDNYSSTFPFSHYWNPYTFIFMTGLRVCPYCNRQYITPIYTKGGKIRADLDHFLPKSEYPYFSMSLQNLVPSCKFCNSSAKGTTHYGFELLNPYCDNIDEHIKFEVNPDTSDKLKVEVISPLSEKLKTENYLKLFKIQIQYSYHKNIVNELLLKRRIYTDQYMDDLFKHYNTYFRSKEEMEELIYGYADKHQIHNEPLAKLRKDIMEQLRPINKKTFLDQLIKLINK